MLALFWAALIALGILCGFYASNKGRRRWLWTLIAFLVSPFVTWVILLLLKDLRREDSAGQATKITTTNSTLLAYASGAFLLLVVGLVGISKDAAVNAPSKVEVQSSPARTPDAPPTSAETPPPLPAQMSSEPPPSEETPPPPPARSHFYVMSEDGEYGYQPGISEDDMKSGTAAKTLLMARYRGQNGKKYRVDLIDNGVTTRFSCESPCQFVKSETFVEGEKLQTQMIAANKGSLIWGILQDAMSGELEIYRKPKN